MTTPPRIPRSTPPPGAPHTRLCKLRHCPTLAINPLISFTDFSILVSFCFYRAWPAEYSFDLLKFKVQSTFKVFRSIGYFDKQRSCL